MNNIVRCRRCGGDYLDRKICSGSGFSLFCAAPESYYAIENYCDGCGHHKAQHENEQCYFDASIEDGFECKCTRFLASKEK